MQWLDELRQRHQAEMQADQVWQALMQSRLPVTQEAYLSFAAPKAVQLTELLPEYYYDLPKK